LLLLSPTKGTQLYAIPKMIPSTILFLTLSTTVAFANYSPPIPPYQASSAISCYSTPPAKFTSRQTIAEPMACLPTCGASPKVSAFLQKVEGGYDCLCAAETDIAGLAGGVCDENGWYVYTPYAVSEDDLASSGSGQAESAEEDIVISNAIAALPPTDDPVAAPAPAAAYAAPATNYGYKRRSRVMGLCDAGLRPCNVPGEEAVYQVSRSLFRSVRDLS